MGFFKDKLEEFFTGVANVGGGVWGLATDLWGASRKEDGLSGKDIQTALGTRGYQGIAGLSDIAGAVGIKYLYNQVPYLAETTRTLFDEAELLWNHEYQRDQDRNPEVFNIANRAFGTDIQPGDTSMSKGLGTAGGVVGDIIGDVRDGQIPSMPDFSAKYQQADYKSPGQMFVDNALNMQDLELEKQEELKQSTGYVFSTGILDGVGRWIFDPLVVGGKGAKKYGETRGAFMGVERFYGKAKKKIERKIGRQIVGLDEIKDNVRAYDGELGPALEPGQNAYIIMDADEAKQAGLWDNASNLNLRNSEGAVESVSPIMPRTKALLETAKRDLPNDSPIFNWDEGGDIYHYQTISKDIDVGTTKARELFDFFLEQEGQGYKGVSKLRWILDPDNSKLPNANDLKNMYKIIDEKWRIYEQTQSAGSWSGARELTGEVRKLAEELGVGTRGIRGIRGQDQYLGNFYDLSPIRAKEIVTEIFLRKIEEAYPSATSFTSRLASQTGKKIGEGEQGKVIFFNKDEALGAARADAEWRQANTTVEASLGKFSMDNKTVVIELDPQGLPVIIPRWDADGRWAITDVSRLEKSSIVKKDVMTLADLEKTPTLLNVAQAKTKLAKLKKEIFEKYKGWEEGTELEIYKFDNDDPYIYLSGFLKKDLQGKGTGNKALQDIIKFADENGLIISGDLENLKLKPWLKRNGFTWKEKGKTISVSRNPAERPITAPMAFWTSNGNKASRLFEDLEGAREANRKILNAYEADGGPNVELSENMMANVVMQDEYGKTGLLDQLINHPRVKTAVEIMEGTKTGGFTRRSKKPMEADEIYKYFFQDVTGGDKIASMLSKAQGTEAKMEVLMAVMGIRMPRSAKGIPGEVMFELNDIKFQQDLLKSNIINARKAKNALGETTPDAHVQQFYKGYKKLKSKDELEEIDPATLKEVEEIDAYLESKFPNRNMTRPIEEYWALNSDEAQKALVDLDIQEKLLAKKKKLMDAELQKAVDVSTAEELSGMLQHVPYTSAGRRLKYAIRNSNIYNNPPFGTGWLVKSTKTAIEFAPRAWLNLSESKGHLQIERWIQEARARFGYDVITPAEMSKWTNRFLNQTRDVDKLETVLAMTEDIIQKIGKSKGFDEDAMTAIIAEMRKGTLTTRGMLQGRRYGPARDSDLAELMQKPQEFIDKTKSKAGSYADTIQYFDTEIGIYVERTLPVLSTQLANWVPLTNLRALQREMAVHGSWIKKYGPKGALQLIEGVGESFYSIWKPSVLLRGAWPIRVVSDEQLRILARGIGLTDHLMAISKTPMSRHIFWDTQIKSAKDWEKFGAIAGAMINAPIRGGTQGLVLLSKVASKFIEINPNKRHLSKIMDQLGSDLEPLVSARAGFSTPTDNVLAQYGSFLTRSEQTLLSKFNKSMKSGEYKSIPKGAEGYSTQWIRALNYQLNGDPFGHKIIKAGVDSFDEMAKLDYFTLDDFVTTYKRNAHKAAKTFFNTEQGKAYSARLPWRSKDIAGTNWATDWADDIMEIILQYTMITTKGADSQTYNLFKKLYNGKLSGNDLAKFPEQYWPAVIHGEEIRHILGQKNGLSRTINAFVTEGFDGLGRLPTDVLSRNPMMRALFALEVDRRSKLLIKQGKTDFTANEIQTLGRQAKQGAIEETQKFMYNIAEQPRLGTTWLRFIMPFFAAQVEVVSVWAGLARRDPSIIPKANMLWKSPNRAINPEAGITEGAGGNYTLITTDDEGNEYITLMLSELFTQDKKWFDTHWGMYVADATFRFNKASFNMMLNNPIGNGGPIVNILANEYYIRNEEKEKTAIAEYLLSWGAKGGTSFPQRVLAGQSPTVRSLVEGFDFYGDYNGQKQKLLIDVATYFDTRVRLGEIDLVTPEEIFHATDTLWWLFASFRYYSSASPIMDTPLKPYRDAYQELVEEFGPEEGTERFIQNYGDEYFAVTRGRTVSKTGLPPTIETEKATQIFKDIILEFPEYGRIIVGDVADVGEFSSTTFAAQISSTVDDKFGQTVIDRFGAEREYKDLTADDFLEDGRLKDIDADIGYQKYGKLMDFVDSMMMEMGLPNLMVKDAQKLAEYRREELDKILEEHPGFAEAFYKGRDLSPDRWDNKIADMEKIVLAVMDPAITNDWLSRPDMIGLAVYIDNRNQMKEVLQASKYKSLDAKANTRLAYEWASIVADIIAEYPEFASIYYRYLEGDPVN